MLEDVAPQSIELATGVTLDVVDVGPRDGPALIFLHGFPESWRTWRHQIAALSGHYRCIAPDQRGYGGSSKPADVAAYAPDVLSADIFALADALGVETFSVIGHDWGGVIAWIVAILGQFNGRVTRAMIANAPHPALFQQRLWTDPEQRAASQYIRLFRDIGHDADIRRHGLAPMLQRAFGSRQAFERLDPSELRRLALRWQDGDAAIAMLNWYRASPVVVPPLDAPFQDPGPITAQLPALKLPTLVLWGENDTALPPGNLDSLPLHVPGARIERLPGVGHFSPWEAPEVVTGAIAAFLANSD